MVAGAGTDDAGVEEATPTTAPASVGDFKVSFKVGVAVDKSKRRAAAAAAAVAASGNSAVADVDIDAVVAEIEKEVPPDHRVPAPAPLVPLFKRRKTPVSYLT